MALRIEDYALIGDLETAALVGKDGSIDWLCWPRFDSGACFAALLGTPEHGRWRIAPTGTTNTIRRRYRDSTLILETEFQTAEGAVEIIDFMPLRERQSDLVRIVRGLRGEVPMEMELILRFDYGESVPWVTRERNGSLRAVAGANTVVLRTSAPLAGEDLKTVSRFTIKKDEDINFALTYCVSRQPPPKPLDVKKALHKTEKFWREWASHCTYKGPWSEAVRRSLVTLKALTYWPTGGMVAAATTSLPEKIGGTRNWDYRFCWLRDASFTLWALMNAGYFEEAAGWMNWLLRAVAGSPEQVQTLYGVAGERLLPEIELNWLPGYEGSKPVRMGNAASQQIQLDVYGEVTAALNHAREGRLPRKLQGFALEEKLLKHLEKIWREPDEGIWETRGPKRQFTHSKVMAWFAFDRAIKSWEKFGEDGPLDRWRAIRQEIHDEICLLGYNADLATFVESYGSKQMDASLLIIAKCGFLPPDDPRIAGTVRAIEKRLLRDGLLMRREAGEMDDGLPPGEGMFLPCSFWLVDNYLLLGRHQEAEHLLKKLLSLRNDLGLLSEEYDAKEKRMVGNFPQAFTHVALVNTLLSFARHRPKDHGRKTKSKPH